MVSKIRRKSPRCMVTILFVGEGICGSLGGDLGYATAGNEVGFFKDGRAMRWLCCGTLERLSEDGRRKGSPLKLGERC